MTSRRTQIFLIGSLILLMTSAAIAFVPSGFRWRLPVPYQVNTASSQEMGRDTTLAAIQASYANWTNPQCSGFRSEFRGETNNGYRVGDGMNTLIWFYDRNQRPRELGGAATIGVTLSLFSGNNASDGDILFNGIDHRWTTNAVNAGQVDAVSIITHETGHQLGLNHSPFQSATMYAAYLGGNGAATLDRDDIEGVCNLYPSGAQADCQNDGDCPDGQRCLGGGCVEQDQAGGGAIGDPCGEGIGGCPEGLFCARGEDGSAFCTRECGAGCPEGWACQDVRGGNGQIFSICLPAPGGGDEPGRGYGEACQNSSQCASGFCIGDGQTSFCSQACASPQDCPPGSECYQVQGGGGACVPGDDPQPQPDPDAGTPPTTRDQFVSPPVVDAGGAPPMNGADSGVPTMNMPDPANPDAQTPTGNGGGGAASPMGEVTVRVARPAQSGCQSTGQSPGTWLLALLGAWGLFRRRLSL